MRYEPALDGLRAVAIIAVVLFHCGGGVVPGGYIGVDIFFVLSGFLITSLLASELESCGSIDLKRFYVRRFLRLAPPLLLMLAAFLIWAPLVWPSENHLRSAGIASMYVADYAIPLIGEPRHLGHMWSLSIEEQFYLIWPWLLVPLMRSRRAVLILGAAYLAVSAWRYVIPNPTAMYNHFDTHCSGLILGCALYFVRYRPTNAAVCAAALALLLLALGAPPFYDRAHSVARTVGFVITPAELAAMVLVAGAYRTDGPLKALLRSSYMVWIGRLSYGIYLWHFPIAGAVRPHLTFLPTLALVATLSTAAAAISYFTIEAWVRSNRLRTMRAAPQT